MEINPRDYCIFIASHMSKSQRIPYLTECITSLVHQTLKIPIYLSISFDNADIENETKMQLQQHSEKYKYDFLNIRYRSEKTPQMQHFNLLIKEFSGKHNWIMFCDDDDTYEPNRTVHIAQLLTISKQQMSNQDEVSLGGVYESTFNKHHREHRHEYWCYCVSEKMIIDFMKVVEKYEDALYDKCCDVLFAEYLRRKSNTCIFLQMPVKYYNYRIEDNSDSITGYIRQNQSKYTLKSKPPDWASETWSEYVFGWDEYVYENMPIFLHDTYLRTIIGNDLQRILKSEFLENFAILPYVDKNHEEKIKKKYNYLRQLCNELYDLKLD